MEFRPNFAEMKTLLGGFFWATVDLLVSPTWPYFIVISDFVNKKRGARSSKSSKK
jgi:hypothetical protein